METDFKRIMIMKASVPQGKVPSKGFSIDSIIGQPTSTSNLNNRSTSSDSNASCPTPPRECSKKRRPDIVKPTPTHLTTQAKLVSGEVVAGIRECQILPPRLPVSLYSQPGHQLRGKEGMGVAAERRVTRIPPGLLPFRSVWGMATSLGRPFPAVPSCLPPSTRPSVPPQALDMRLPVGTLPLTPGLLGGMMSPQDSLHRPLYPWLLARQSYCLGYPFSGPAEASCLYHWHRKPKRNRTAFSPGQLLRLEQAFDNNHYVVGQERKELAAKLSLTETQVKVWFQNRRTKHKRMKAEEDNGSDDVAKDEASSLPQPRQSKDAICDDRPDPDMTCCEGRDNQDVYVGHKQHRQSQEDTDGKPSAHAAAALHTAL